jgi:hypothetical protein
MTIFLHFDGVEEPVWGTVCLFALAIGIWALFFFGGGVTVEVKALDHHIIEAALHPTLHIIL